MLIRWMISTALLIFRHSRIIAIKIEIALPEEKQRDNIE